MRSCSGTSFVEAATLGRAIAFAGVDFLALFAAVLPFFEADLDAIAAFATCTSCNWVFRLVTNEPA
jgi:hypothetical protein